MTYNSIVIALFALRLLRYFIVYLSTIVGNNTNKFITLKYFNLVVIPTVVHRHGIIILFYLIKKKGITNVIRDETPRFGGT